VHFHLPIVALRVTRTGSFRDSKPVKRTFQQCDRQRVTRRADEHLRPGDGGTIYKDRASVWSGCAQMRLPARELRSLKPSSIGAGGSFGSALEQAAKERRILVADVTSDALDRVRGTQPARSYGMSTRYLGHHVQLQPGGKVVAETARAVQVDRSFPHRVRQFDVTVPDEIDGEAVGSNV
jgi:hypothetical protein